MMWADTTYDRNQINPERWGVLMAMVGVGPAAVAGYAAYVHLADGKSSITHISLATPVWSHHFDYSGSDEHLLTKS